MATKSLYDSASCVSKNLLAFLDPVFRIGASRPLTADDMWVVMQRA